MLNGSVASPKAKHRKEARHVVRHSPGPYEELYASHAHAARTVALALVPANVADDIVSESFTRVMAAGASPENFRPYLMATVRNTAADWHRASRRTVVTGDFTGSEAKFGLTGQGADEAAVARHEDELVARAFTELPTRWRAVLWRLEVERQTPAVAAAELSMTANAVSALAVRAREGLKQAYLKQHVRDVPPSCQPFTEMLSASARGKLTRRRSRQLEAHLEDCAGCRAIASEMADINSRLRVILLPAFGATSLALLKDVRNSEQGPVSHVAGDSAPFRRPPSFLRPVVKAAPHLATPAGAGLSTGIAVTAAGAVAVATTLLPGASTSPAGADVKTPVAVVSAVPSAVASAVPGVTGGVKTPAGLPVPAVSGAAGAVASTAGQAQSALNQAVADPSGAVAGVTGTAGGAVASVGKHAASTVQGVTGAAGSAVSGVTGTAGSTVSGVTGAVGSAVASVGKHAKPVVSALPSCSLPGGG